LDGQTRAVIFHRLTGARVSKTLLHVTTSSVNGDVTQVLELLSNKSEALCSNPRTTKKQKKKKLSINSF
jgi:hypothetical protein